jgi:hypothetical protein
MFIGFLPISPKVTTSGIGQRISPLSSRISGVRIISRPPGARTSYTRAFEAVLSHFGPGGLEIAYTYIYVLMKIRR